MYVRKEVGRKVGLAALLLGSALLVGCLGLGEVCEPGEINACPCGDGEEGVQTCGDSGDRWGSCECGAVDHLRDDTDAGGTADTGTGADTDSGGTPGLDATIASDKESSLDDCSGTGSCADQNEACIQFAETIALCVTTCSPSGGNDQCAAGRECVNVGASSPEGGLCLIMNGTGEVCGPYEEALCSGNATCLSLESGSQVGVCLDPCSSPGATCSGAPAGSDYRCVLGSTADNPEFCGFLCSPHSSSPCPSGLQCGSDGLCLPCEGGDCGGSSGGGGGGGSSAPACGGGDNIDHCPGFRCCCPNGLCATVRQCSDGHCVMSEWDVCQDMSNGSSPVCSM